jgi:hypothetical protein
MEKRKILLIMILLLSFTMMVRADLILLKNGGKIEGKVTTIKDDLIMITLPNGSMTLPRGEVKQIIRGVTNVELYQQLKVAIDPNDAEGYYQLGLWCWEHKLPQYHKESLTAAITINPDHEKARKALGYERHEGRWITNDELMALKGYILHQGKWVTQSQYQQIFVEEFQKQLAEERRVRQDAEQRLVQAELRIRSLESELSRLSGMVQRLSEEVSKPRYIIVRKPWPVPLRSDTNITQELQQESK